MVTWNTINDNMTLNAIFSDTSHASETEGPWQLHFRALSIMEKTEPLQIRFTLRLRDQWSEWIQDECKVYMDSSMASNGSCFMVTWIIFKNHLLEVGLTQNRKTIPLWNLTTVDLLYFIMCEDPAWIENHRNNIWLRAWPHMSSHYTEGPWPRCMILEIVLERCEPKMAHTWVVKPWKLIRMWLFTYEHCAKHKKSVSVSFYLN